jgi:hypothetical protein
VAARRRRSSGKSLGTTPSGMCVMLKEVLRPRPPAVSGRCPTGRPALALGVRLTSGALTSVPYRSLWRRGPTRTCLSSPTRGTGWGSTGPALGWSAGISRWPRCSIAWLTRCTRALIQRGRRGNQVSSASLRVLFQAGQGADLGVRERRLGARMRHRRGSRCLLPARSARSKIIKTVDSSRSIYHDRSMRSMHRWVALGFRPGRCGHPPQNLGKLRPRNDHNSARFALDGSAPRHSAAT